jgi:hypothetical protein
MKRLLAALSFVFWFAPFAAAQLSTQYLDSYTARIKPDKRLEFDAVCKRIAEANRKAKGDTFIAMESVYGDDDTVTFVSQRQNYAAIDQATLAFVGAINEAYGVGGMKKMMMDFGPTIISAHTVLRRRRPDLSVNAPGDENAYTQLVGNTRYLRITEIRVRPGHIGHFEERIKQAKAAYEKGGNSWTIFVSQAVAGAPSGTFYLSTLQPSMAGFDSAPNLRQLMGDNEYAEFEKGAEAEEFAESTIYHFLPELSNPPKEVADVSPDFWRPKPAAMARPKPKTTEPTKTGQP